MKKCLLAIALLLCPAALHAQSCLVVTPNGSGTKTGADWNNAMAGLPHPLVRGVTYFLADGTYPDYFSFDVPVDANHTLVTIKKAVSGDHCTNTGWNATTMGSGQATISSSDSTGGCLNLGIAMTANSGYLTIDGQTGRGNDGTSYGIRMPSSATLSHCDTDPHNIWIGAHGAYSATNITIKHVEIIGSCGGIALNSSWNSNCATVNETKNDQNIYTYNCTNCTFDHLYIHDSSGTPFEPVYGNTNYNITHCYIWRNMYTAKEHSGGDIQSHGGNSGITFAYNVTRDWIGTSAITSLNSGTAGTDSNFLVYGNVWFNSSGNPYGQGSPGGGDGVLACINGNNCPGWVFYQNTIVNEGSLTDGVVYINGSTGDVQVKNNLWYASQSTDGTTFQGLPSGSSEDYNSFLSAAVSPKAGGSHDVVATSAPNPFTNWTGSDFTLASEATAWSNRASLPDGQWSIDMAGNTFTTDRGAYQYLGSSTQPAPPSSLTVTGVS